MSEKKKNEIHVVYGVKSWLGGYDVLNKTFKTKDAYDAFNKDLIARGFKIIGESYPWQKKDKWDWQLFFDRDPKFTPEQEWELAIEKAKELGVSKYDLNLLRSKNMIAFRIRFKRYE